jgi:hypothetical protein
MFHGPKTAVEVWATQRWATRMPANSGAHPDNVIVSRYPTLIDD